MVGQEKLQKRFLLNTISKIPHTCLFIGEKGSGRHLLISEFGNKYNIEIVDITENIKLENIENIIIDPISKVYLIDVDKINEQKQNVILKFIEEPPASAYIFLIAENTNNIIDTVINRCQVFTFELYSRSELKQFMTSENNILLAIASTPGQVIKYQDICFEPYIDLVDKILTKINVANYANTLSIVDKLKIKDTDKGELDLDIFIRILNLRALDFAFKNENFNHKVYEIINNFYRDYKVKTYDKKWLVENLLTKLKVTKTLL